MRNFWLLLFAAGTSAASDDQPIDNIIVEAAKTPVTQAELATRISVIDAEKIDRELS